MREKTDVESILRHSTEAWDAILKPSDGLEGFPDMADRAAWSGLLEQAWPPAHRNATRERVQSRAGEAWPGLPASLLRRFAEDGDRVAFQNAYFARRERITDLALLMAMDGNMQPLDDLVDGLWLLCEESSWCLPAHWHLAALPRRPVCGLPPEEEQVDLFAAETAALLAWVCVLCKDALAGWDAGLVPRLRREVIRRCLQPVLDSDGWFWWDGHHNWSPWIAANLLTAGAVFLEDRSQDCQLVARMSGVLQRYLAHIPEDGYCDEGPSYWNAGTGMIVVALELIRQRTGGRVDAFKLPKLRAMGAYLAATHLGHGRYIAAADSNPRLQLHPEIPILLGTRCGLPELVEIGWAFHHAQGHNPVNPLMGGGGLGPRLRRLWWMDHRRTPSGRTPTAQVGTDTWFPSGQLAVMRETAVPGEGFSAAVKFGHNRENHNHLDVGQVIVHWREAPLLIDPGVDSYRSDHFSPRRYSVPWVGAEAHNAPILNQCGQTPGTGFGFFEAPEHAGLSLAAREVHFAATRAHSRISGDLAPCYPEVPDLISVHRSVDLYRGPKPSVRLTDDVRAEAPCSVEISWLTACPPADITRHGWTWRVDGEEIPAKLEGAAEVRCERLPLDDPQLCEGWGAALWRIRASVPPKESVCLTLWIGDIP
ncbi:MAG: heparinase II/III family protein [Verrucomicrobia bacterium]|nr:heparinase II/III family protein [Verrucomicrobiota bacterium]MCH8514061.1 heparinase II/III family protein [Kiritimatiellia bacterium]